MREDHGGALVYLVVKNADADSVLRQAKLPILVKFMMSPREHTRSEQGFTDTRTKLRVIRYDMELHSLETATAPPIATMILSANSGTANGYSLTEFSLEYRDGAWQVLSERLILAS